MAQVHGSSVSDINNDDKLRKMADSWNALDVAARIEDLKYMYASIANVSNFVSVKLSGRHNYNIWRYQMLCLMDSHKMRGLIDVKFFGPPTKSEEIKQQYDHLLKGWIFGTLSEDILRAVIGIESAQGVWRKLESLYEPGIISPKDGVTKNILIIKGPTEMEMKMTGVNQRLHKATVEGNWWDANYILQENTMSATVAINNDGDTMLHIAVEKGQNDFVKNLLDIIHDRNEIEKKNLDGRTALHIAAIVSNKYGAQLLVNVREQLLGIVDNNLHVPLLSAYYNMKLNTFEYLLNAVEIEPGQPPYFGLYAGSGFQIGVDFLITAISTKQYDLALKMVNTVTELVTRDDQVLMAMVITFPDDLGFKEALMYPLAQYKNMEKKKEDYRKAKMVLELICNKIDARYNGSHHSCYNRPILEAASQGAIEILEEILSRSPKAISWKNKDEHNIIQLAIINRSEKIYNHIQHKAEHKELFRTIIDSSNNNILHLAGRLAPSTVLARTAGAALQLQRELQWFQEIKKLMLPIDHKRENISKETPEMVFTKEHKDLVKEGETWMKTTAESSSITAALIITIVFAAAITVPGGSNQETGIPLFKKDIAFTIFAVSDAISLFTALTALLVFLSILTARFAENDFLVSLPRRLIIGLFALFISTTAMMVAFSAIFYLVFCDQRKWMLAPIGVLACLPIGVIVTMQFPLVVDLVLSTYVPIFGKQNYIDPSKVDADDMRSFFIIDR